MQDIEELIDAVEPTKWTRVKAHLRDNKAIYIGTAVGVAGLVGGGLLARRNNAIILQYKTENCPVTLTQIVELVRRHNPGKVIRDTETGEVYASIRRTAQAVGKSQGFVQKNIGGRFEYLGESV